MDVLKVHFFLFFHDLMKEPINTRVTFVNLRKSTLYVIFLPVCENNNRKRQYSTSLPHNKTGQNKYADWPSKKLDINADNQSAVNQSVIKK
jgi:hypothetical protein